VIAALLGGLLVGIGSLSLSHLLGAAPTAVSGAIILAITLIFCVLLLRYLDLSTFLRGKLREIDRELEAAEQQSERAARELKQVRRLSE
jgi:hypothetical protein